MVNHLADIAKIIGRLEGVNLLKPAPALRRKNRIHTIQSSLSIEGNSLTRDQVTAVLQKKRVMGPKQDIVEVQNAIRVYGMIEGFNPFSIAAFLKAQGVLMAGLIPSPGEFRTSPIGVIRPGNIFHEAPRWESVEPMMQSLFSYLKNSDDHLLLKSSRFHFQLEHIHPFVDGNGRMGRLWQSRILMVYHPIFEFLPVEDFICERQSDYYQMLALGDDTGDCTEFVVFLLSMIQKSLQQLLKETRSITLTPEDRLDLARRSIENGPFSRKEYQMMFKTISTATASRDLQKGVKMGLLRRTGDKRTAVYEFKGVFKAP